ncbi:glycosyltransferase family 2 protein [Candidatus Dojkabacteria bacterium]|nr:glycosyltransferase family 2 protein [Candidatus Dojkabacteria bacterium]
MAKISAVINTLNESKKVGRCLSSLKGFANEIIVVDMMSTDSTVDIAKKYGAKVFKHKRIGYVEPARNFAISKARYDWIIILDADEELSEGLKSYIKKEIKEPQADYYRIPRKNIIFGKWMKHSGWWPDYNIRFFKKGSVSWNEVIHSIPMTVGKGLDLPQLQDYSIKHRNYSSVEEYVTRMNKYTTIQAKDLNKKGVEFKWRFVISKPVSEFLRRYFAESGYKDGLHGLTVCLLQTLSELVIYAKLWQKQNFRKVKIDQESTYEELKKASSEFIWWVYESKIKSSKNIFIKLWLKTRRKLQL